MSTTHVTINSAQSVTIKDQGNKMPKLYEMLFIISFLTREFTNDFKAFSCWKSWGEKNTAGELIEWLKTCGPVGIRSAIQNIADLHLCILTRNGTRVKLPSGFNFYSLSQIISDH